MATRSFGNQHHYFDSIHHMTLKRICKVLLARERYSKSSTATLFAPPEPLVLSDAFLLRPLVCGHPHVHRETFFNLQLVRFARTKNMRRFHYRGSGDYIVVFKEKGIKVVQNVSIIKHSKLSL